MRLNCPCCGLSLNPRSAMIAPHYCPRCLVRRRVAVEFIVTQPGDPADGLSFAGGSASAPGLALAGGSTAAPGSIPTDEYTAPGEAISVADE